MSTRYTRATPRALAAHVLCVSAAAAPATTRWLRPLLLGALGAVWSLSAAHAQPLPPPAYVVEIQSAVGGHDGHLGAVPLNLHIDWSGQWGSGNSYSMQATAETFGGLRPMAAVQAACSSGNFVFSIYSTASVEYYARIRPRRTPPAGSYSVPILVSARGEAQGYATAQVRVNYGIPIQVNTVNSTRSFDAVIPVDVYPSDPDGNLVVVNLLAYAVAYRVHPTYPDSSQAYADPLFTFDQATFDLYQGPDTFSLDEYFEFEYSEHLLNPPSPPVVTLHPQSQAPCEGGVMTLTAAASSTAALTYQWRLDGSELTDGDGIVGCTTAALTIDPMQTYDAGSYDCLITNIAGSVATNPASVTIEEPPVVTIPPQPVTVTSGDSVVMSVTATGSEPLVFQWRRNGIALTNDSRITGASTASLSINPVASADAGSYDVVVSNDCGAPVSGAAILTVAGCGTADFNGDGDVGTDADIEAFFACLGGDCCAICFAGGADFNDDGDVGTDADIESFFRVLGGGPC